MTPEQLAESKRKWEAEWPHSLRDKVSDLIWRKLIKSEGEGAVVVKFSFLDESREAFCKFTHHITSEFGKDLLFETIANARTRLDGDDVKYTYLYKVEYKE